MHTSPVCGPGGSSRTTCPNLVVLRLGACSSWTTAHSNHQIRLKIARVPPSPNTIHAPVFAKTHIPSFLAPLETTQCKQNISKRSKDDTHTNRHISHRKERSLNKDHHQMLPIDTTNFNPKGSFLSFFFIFVSHRQQQTHDASHSVY